MRAAWKLHYVTDSGIRMAKLDLPEHYRHQLVPLLETHVPDAEVWAYGSRVKGRSHDSSDLDLVLRNPADLSKTQMWPLIELREAIRESNLPILVDVLDWARPASRSPSGTRSSGSMWSFMRQDKPRPNFSMQAHQAWQGLAELNRDCRTSRAAAMPKAS